MVPGGVGNEYPISSHGTAFLREGHPHARRNILHSMVIEPVCLLHKDGSKKERILLKKFCAEKKQLGQETEKKGGTGEIGIIRSFHAVRVRVGTAQAAA